MGKAVDHLRYMVINAFQHPGIALVWMWHPVSSFIALLVIVEWFARDRNHPLERLPTNSYLRWAIYIALALAMLVRMDMHTHEFIYFQF